MIKIDQVLNLGGNIVEGLEISVGGKLYFISTNQTAWPGIRIGEFPDVFDHHMADIKRLPREKIFEIDN